MCRAIDALPVTATFRCGDQAMKTIVGSFDSFDAAKQVARELMDEGFRDGDVNVVASNLRGNAGDDHRAASAPDAGSGIRRDDPSGRTVDATLAADGAGLTERRADAVADDASGAATGAVTGGVVGGAAGLAASLMGLAIPGIGPIIAAGPIVATLSGAGVGAVAGGLIGGLTDLGVDKADAEYYAESVRRGGALVTVRADDTRAERAADIMRDHGAVDIERRAEQWREKGWSGWNPDAKPYTTNDLDRDLYGATDATTGIAQPADAPIGDRTGAPPRVRTY